MADEGSRKDQGQDGVDCLPVNNNHNHRELLLTNYNNVSNSVPETKEINYSFDHG